MQLSMLIRGTMLRSLENIIFKDEFFNFLTTFFLHSTYLLLSSQGILKWRRVTQSSSFQRSHVACRVAYFPRCEREENSEIEMQEKRARQRETISGEVRGWGQSVRPGQPPTSPGTLPSPTPTQPNRNLRELEQRCATRIMIYEIRTSRNHLEEHTRVRNLSIQLAKFLNNIPLLLFICK